MVGTATPAISQAQDGDRKRKPTIERAKAHHLCRQLQMRLQYARLKVEHGWQKQSLNEVENLYFHHSHQKFPKPVQPRIVVVTTTQPEQAPYPPPSNPQSSLSFISRTATSSFASSTGMGTGSLTYSDFLNRATTMSSFTTASSGRNTPVPGPGTGQMLPPSTTPTPGPMSTPGPDTGHTPLLPTPKSPQRPSPALQSPATLRPSSGPPPQFASSTEQPPPLPPTLPSPTSPSKRSRVQKSHPAASAASTPKPTPAPFLNKDPFHFSSAGMTYDSFWSTHSASPRTSQLRAPTAGPAPSNLGQHAQAQV
ncbi:hypothetical protein D9611_011494 [Ephemerocybe angulata]|uniref:Uncharacterized protein n=1 Tax=Ephemerocybe angulata TaxID=980116 RepID=A0A8H5CF38_9AGAR|nr:hypothetical protein D9611_011494 [Tulosesus angulatus]